MAFGRVWQHAEYSYRVWQSFDHNSGTFKNCPKWRRVNNLLKCSDLEPKSRTNVFYQPERRVDQTWYKPHTLEALLIVAGCAPHSQEAMRMGRNSCNTKCNGKSNEERTHSPPNTPTAPLGLRGLYIYVVITCLLYLLSFRYSCHPHPHQTCWYNPHLMSF